MESLWHKLKIATIVIGVGLFVGIITFLLVMYLPSRSPEVSPTIVFTPAILYPIPHSSKTVYNITTDVESKCLSMGFDQALKLQSGNCGAPEYYGEWWLYPDTNTLINKVQLQQQLICLQRPVSELNSDVIGSSYLTEESCKGININLTDGLITTKTISSNKNVYIAFKERNIPVWTTIKSTAVRFSFKESFNK